MFGLFKSGIGIQYSDSLLNYNETQSAAQNIIVGRRFPPEIVLRAGDDMTVQIHDLLPSDTAFKLLIFTGNLYNVTHSELVSNLAQQLVESPLLVQRPIGQGKSIKMVDPITIVRGRKGEVRWSDVPAALRSHWSK